MTPMTERPHVSVIIPAFNVAHCVERAVDSVLAQTWQDCELLVVDDGSRDRTQAVLRQYGGRLRLITKSNGGLSSARNAGIACARGRLVAFLDADDWWLPEKLERQVHLMHAQPALAFCSTEATIVSPDGTEQGTWTCGQPTDSVLEAIFNRHAYVAGSGSAVMARRDALFRAGAFDETLRSLEDIDMWMRLAAQGSYACVPEPLTLIEKRADSMSGNLEVMRAAARQVMRKNRALLPVHCRGAFWRRATAGALSDYAKWALRAGRSRQALADIGEGLMLAPVSRGRLFLGLLLAMLLRRPV